MPTIQVESDQLLKAVEQLSPHELEAFVAQVLAVRAQREAPTLSAAESTLLLTINSAIPEPLQQRYDELIVQRQAEQLTPTEHAELLQLTIEIEQREADRVAALADLARLRGVPLTQLMQTLGIQPTYA